MSFWETLLLALALAMDCFTVSITCGIIQQRMGRQVWAMALLFGFFQGLMPLLGWWLTAFFREEITAYDHWVSFFLLAFLGGKMIVESSRKEENYSFNPSKTSTLLMLSVATSIDALAVGFSFVGMGFRDTLHVLSPVLVIGATSFIMAVLGKYIGTTLGRRFNWPAEKIGGVILILIGLKVLIEHLTA